jgi:2-dehydro-3-deoxy-D-arabinonate dehydratase
MKLASISLADGERRLAAVEEDVVQLLDLTQVENCHNLSDILHSPDPVGMAKFLVDQKTSPLAADAVQFLAPVDHQQIWAAGVTYKRSQTARMEESESAASHYDKVYTADRPELFFKAFPANVGGMGDPVRVRFDSSWSVPEPEFTLVISPEQKIVGYTIGNDMSARDIEGENPLYLPQAKVYNQSCAIGPCILLAEDELDLPNVKIEMAIHRTGEEVFQGDTDLGQLARTFEDLVSWLYRENDYPTGTMMLTGTGVVPPDNFTLENGDSVTIKVTNIGELTNPVVKD